MSRATASALSPTRRAWIAGLVPDCAWVILAPLLAWGLLQTLWRFAGLSDLTLYALLFALIVTGHHMPGWLRAFGEPEVYGRHKARLWTALLCVPALVVGPTACGYGALALSVAAAFDLWHVARQQHGFGRIYAAKRGEVDRLSARLDLACVLVWYGTAVLWSDAWMQGLAAAFRRAGLPLLSRISPGAWGALELLALAASLALLAAYVARACTLWRRTGAVALHKHALHAAFFAVIALSYQDPSWYRAQSVQNLFHAVQYFFLVWIYGRLSLRRDPRRPRAFYRALFGARPGILLFALAVGLYGLGAWTLSSSSYRFEGWSEERAAQLIGSLGIASLLLHFYVDAFIWKVRARDVRRTLDLAAGAEAREPRPPRLAGALHAFSYFGAPTLALALLGAARAAPAPGETLRLLAAEAALFPRSAAARQDHALALLRAGDVPRAQVELAAALELSPSTEGPAFLLAELARGAGELDAERAYVRAALAAAPAEPELHALLGAALRRQGDEAGAAAAFSRALALDPDHSGAHLGLGLLLRQRERVDLALGHLERAHELEPDRAETVCHFAGALASLGRGAEALELLADFRARHPEDAGAPEFERRLRARL